MKNLFKNLMLVAVAAMAFTACQKDNDETNKTEQKTVITGVATIANDDTRSGFTEKVGDAYQSAWDGGEKVAVHYDGSGDVWTNMNADGTFEVTLDGAVSAITLCSPYDAWYGTVQVDPSIFATQTPLADSVDPKVHVLKSEETPVVNGTASVTMKHEVAYGKMSIVGLPDDFEIARVELTINGYTTYALNAENVKGNVFWFAAAEFEVNELTIRAYDAENYVYHKTVTTTVEKPLSFNKGRVSTFSVSNLEKQEEKGVVLTKATGSIAEGVTNNGRQCYNIYFKTEDEAITVWVQVASDTNCLEATTYSTDIYEYYINSCSWTNIGSLWPLNMDVEVVDGQYSIKFDGKDYNNEGAPCAATFVGAIDGFTLPSTDPYMELDKKELTFNAAAASKDITVTTKNTTEAINAISDNAQFTVTVNGKTVTVDAAENTTSDDITGTITITCGSLSDTVAVTQRKPVEQSSTIVADACDFTNNMDMGQGWGRRYNLNNASGLELDLWVDQPAADEFTGYMVAGTYGYQPEWCDYDTNDMGFVVKQIKLPGADDWTPITTASMVVTRDGDTHNITLDVTTSDSQVYKVTFSGTITKKF